MTAENPFGVRIPPDKGDANYEGAEHDAEAFRQGQPPDVTFGWWCLTADCGVEVTGLPSAIEATTGAARHAQSAPETPHAPASAPNATPRGSADTTDGSEALRGALAEEWARHSTPPLFCDDDGDARCKCGTWLTYRDNFDRHRLAALLPLVLAYGREQAARALRDAADDTNTRAGFPWSAAISNGAHFECEAQVALWLHARADELGAAGVTAPADLTPEQAAELPYCYHVAYAHNAGFGRTAFYRSRPITGPDQVKEWEELIAAAGLVRQVVVLSWQQFEVAP